MKQPKWKPVKLFFVEYTYYYDSHDNFYRGFQEGGGGKGLSRFFFTKEEAEAQIERWKIHYPVTGHVHTSTYYTLKSIQVWMRGWMQRRSFQQRFLFEKPETCDCPCPHCPINKIEGFTLVQLMIKAGVRRPELTKPELEYVCQTSYDIKQGYNEPMTSGRAVK